MSRQPERVAQQVHVTQPSLSQAISKLEQDLGASLFVRTSRGTRLTEAGRALRQRALHLLEDADKAMIGRSRGDPFAAPLRIAYTMVAAGPALWSALREASTLSRSVLIAQSQCRRSGLSAASHAAKWG